MATLNYFMDKNSGTVEGTDKEVGSAFNDIKKDVKRAIKEYDARGRLFSVFAEFDDGVDIALTPNSCYVGSDNQIHMYDSLIEEGAGLE
jgi:hypothetical protein